MHSQNAIPPSGGTNEVTADDGIYAISYTDDQRCNGSDSPCPCCICPNGLGCCLCSEGPQWTWHKFVFDIPEGKDISNGTFKWNGKSTYPGGMQYSYSVYLTDELDYWYPYTEDDPTTGTFPIGYILHNHASESTFIYSLTYNDINLINQNRSAIFYVDNMDCSTLSWALQTDYVEFKVTLIDTPSSGINSYIVASPFEVYSGETINVVMTVQNLGSSTVTNVVPSQLNIVGDGQAVLISGPNPSSTDIPSGSQVTFEWTYKASRSGKIAFRGNASSNGDISSGASTSNEIMIKGASGAINKKTLPIESFMKVLGLGKYKDANVSIEDI